MSRALSILCAVIVTMGDPLVRADGQTDRACTEQLLLPAQIRCFLDLAKAANEPSICERAIDPTVRFHCLSLYAEHTLDATPCQRIVAGSETDLLQASCVSGVAIAQRNPGLCAQVNSSGIRDSCYFLLVVQFDANPRICEQIENPALKTTCRE